MNPALALLLRVPLHGMGLLAAALPRSWEMALGAALGRVALLLDRKRARIARENIERCLPELGPAERRALLRRNYEHYGRLFLELCHMFTPIAGHYRAYARRVAKLEGIENWRSIAARGKGAIFCGSHLANWELSVASAGQEGVPIHIVTRRLKPAWLHDWMEKARASVGVSCIYQPRTLPGVMRALKDGGVVVFVVDQYMPPPMGEPMRFLGVEVDTLAAVAPLARRTGAAVLLASTRREPDGRLRGLLEPEYALRADDRTDNQNIIDAIVEHIRRTPEQWIWGHRRFKNVDWSRRAPR